MGKNQLNFSVPLMSARRYSSPLRRSGEEDESDSPTKNRDLITLQPSEVNMDEVVKPGSVPFMWEQAPGKAKGGNESQVQSPDAVINTSKLPPNMPFPPGKKSGELNGYRTPNMLSGELAVLRPRNKVSGELNVPRQHRFSGELNTLRPNKWSGELSTLRPNKWSGELSTLRPHAKVSRELKTSSAKFFCSNDGMVRRDASKEGSEKNASSGTEDDDVTFSDAIETFSQHESHSINCSVSGLSASERPETKPSDNLPTDPKARDFMMSRFLPAAKAMTIEPSQYSSRKQLVAVEQPKEEKALVPRAQTPPPSRNIYNIVPYTGQDIGSGESEDEEENSYDGRSALSVKVKACGFLPWFCSKNSLRLINPLPSMKDKSRSALSSASKLSKLVKTKSWRSPSQKLVKHDSYNNPKHKVGQVYKSCELQKPKHTSRPMFYSGELQTRSGSPYRNSRRGNGSPYRNESPQSLYQKGVGVLTVTKEVDSFDDNRSIIPQKGSKRLEESGRKTRNSGTRTPTVEKTLHVDSANIAKVSHSILNLPKNKRQVIDASVQEAVKSENLFEHGGRMEIMKARGMSGPLVCSGVDSSEPSRIPGKVNTNTCRELVLVSNETATMQSALNPPLPKSPSESWLSRQLPSVSPRVSPRNSVSYSSLNSKLLSRKQNANTPTSGAKWENIVKSSHLRQDHGRYSEELVTHAPQQSRRWK